MDEMYTKEYQEILVDIVNNPNLPIVWNLNIGHATPRAIVPFGVMARVDVEKQKISLSTECKKFSTFLKEKKAIF